MDRGKSSFQGSVQQYQFANAYISNWCIGESGIRTRGPKILNHMLNIIPKSTAFEISNLGFMAFPAGIYNKIVDGNQTFQLYYPI